MPQHPSIGLIVGSVSQPSLNRRFADAVAALAPAAGLELVDIAIDALPFYGTQYDEDFPVSGREFKDAVESVAGLLIVTPEYNRSIPGVLKNAVDWATRPSGQSSLEGRPTAVMGATKGAISTAVAQAHLKSVLVSQRVPVLPAEAYIRIGDGYFDDDGAIAAERDRAFVDRFLRGFREFVERF